MLALSLSAPDSAHVHQMLAHEETKQGNTNGAVAQFRQAVAINPHLPRIDFELAELLHTSQDPAVKKEAEQEYRLALVENPQDEKAILRLAQIDARKGKPRLSNQNFRPLQSVVIVGEVPVYTRGPIGTEGCKRWPRLRPHSQERILHAGHDGYDYDIHDCSLAASDADV